MTTERPATFEHPQVGPLNWREGGVAYQREIALGGLFVSFEVIVDPPAWTAPMTVSALIDQGAATLATVRTNWERINDRIGASLVEEYGERWRGARPVLSANQLLEHLRLMSVTVYHDGHAEMFFSDDGVDTEGLFSGHYVIVVLLSSGEVIDVSLAG